MRGPNSGSGIRPRWNSNQEKLKKRQAPAGL
jgi:hypothetical protein